MTERERENVPPEVPEADALEQQDVVGDEDLDDELPDEPPLDADPADVSEQRRSVPLSEEEYR
ncbi:MAG TPA: hypothetical protein VFV76_05310 [Actinomycetes bacterium]|jgi:hypothetical protein|nr:hypothetical protein [Actinomycetes bacterium]